jgi:hypothetical protein
MKVNIPLQLQLTYDLNKFETNYGKTRNENMKKV